ncbi:ABC-type branched-subunit amino acid transport system substrate-binding protein [Thermocatellispora tengchongensis]|uniref:ABC-type branched-subunit amino acid transport system substrate-binding protein n=1 Tax=Thermocatellispora tengchongensis TaxID=1073253 RepID=A0A840P1S1_9ACTN|nr:ABC transporter substrate-binding protein [Thermocatellispora tengchongensis]MBB5131410.1 ABC-type branched-subunit amino acid transport system substrate-binding protein [Thermocatellispora tengchongensis]
MTGPSNDKHFHVMAPARAYGVLVAVSGLLLAIGLVLPLALASSAPADAGARRGDTGPIEIDSGSTRTDGAPASTGTSTAGRITDVAQGVTGTTIKVGVVLLDLSSVASLGLGLPNYEVELQQAAFDSLFDAINAGGGINGRTIEPIYVSRDTIATTGPHSDKAICTRLAKDERVFAVIGFTYEAGTCAALQYQLPVVTRYPALEHVYRDSHGLLATLDPPLEQLQRNWANVLVKAGFVKGRKVGMLTVADGSTYQLSGKAAADTLERLGYPLTVMGELDPANSVSEIPALIQKMKSAGVDSVMLASDFANALRFIALAEAQRYRPQYLTSDLGSLASNGVLANAGQSLDGVIGFTNNAWPRGGAPTTPENQACLDNYHKTTTTKKIPPGEQSAVPLICAITQVFVRAATDAGTDLNPRSFVQALERIGTIDGLPAVLRGTFAPGKTGYSDQLQPVRWSSATKSYSAAGSPVDVR